MEPKRTKASNTLPLRATTLPHHLVGAMQRWGYSSFTAATRFASASELEQKLSAAEKYVVRAKRVGKRNRVSHARRDRNKMGFCDFLSV
jgi:hypothetical protein